MKGKITNDIVRLLCLVTLVIISDGHYLYATSPRVAYDMDEAEEICDDLPLDIIEGIWLYPDDNVFVLILSEEDRGLSSSFQKYNITVVQTTDSRLHPGELIGSLQATPEPKTFKIELATERNNHLLLKPKMCLANLSKDGDAFTFKKQKSGIRGRLNLNLSRLLPGFWKMISTGISTSSQGQKIEAPVGMIKIYPSYDGNGSSLRKVRYL